MNSLPRIKTATLLFAGLLALAPLSLHAQTFPGWPSWSAGVQTIGGITYFNFGTGLPSCDRIVTGPVHATGHSFTLSVHAVRGDFCIDCLNCYNLETNSVVLGQLAPGNYSLTAGLWLVFQRPDSHRAGRLANLLHRARRSGAHPHHPAHRPGHPCGRAHGGGGLIRHRSPYSQVRRTVEHRLRRRQRPVQLHRELADIRVSVLPRQRVVGERGAGGVLNCTADVGAIEASQGNEGRDSANERSRLAALHHGRFP
jgi:hypothetical protein